MKENNGIQEVIGGKTMTWIGISAAVLILLLTFGFLIYNFITSVP